MIDIIHLSITGFTLTKLKTKRMIHPFLNVWRQLSSRENNFKEGDGVNEWRAAREDSVTCYPAGDLKRSTRPPFSLKPSTRQPSSSKPAALPPRHFPPEPPPSFIKRTVTFCYSWNYGLTSTQQLELSSLQCTTPTKERKMESLTDLSPVYPTQQKLSLPLK